MYNHLNQKNMLKQKLREKREKNPLIHYQSFPKQLKKCFISAGCCLFCMNVLAQSPKKISLNLKNATLEEVIWEIRKQSDIVVMYGTTDVQSVKNLTINEKDKSIKDILDKCLKGTNLTYEISDNEIIIKQKNNTQNRTIKGIVIDKDGNPLPGVTIRLKNNENIGTTTNIDGEYQIKISGEYPILVYSFIGMESKELSVRSKDEINVTLSENVKTLQDVVVTGIFRRNKELATGASTTITAKELKQVGNQNILQSLRSLDPSIKIVESQINGSNPNALPEIEMRGANGITDLDANYTGNPNQPLFILDGFETTLQRVVDMDPNRVASITILKDASAAALYGSRSANGVIVIETLAPEEGRIQVSYTGDYAINIPDLSDYNLVNAKEKLQIEWDAGHFESTDMNTYNQLQNYYQELKRNVEEGVNTDWLAQPIESSFEHRHNLRLEGGDKTVRYSMNLTARNAPGVMKGSGRTSYEGGMFLSYRTENLIFKNDLQLTYNKAENSPYGSFSTYTQMNPYQRPYDENGKAQKLFYESAPSYFSRYNRNPLYDSQLNITDEEDYFNFVNNFSMEWNINEHFTLMSRFSITRQTGESNYFIPAQHSKYSEMGDPVSDPEEYMRRGEYQWGTNKSLSLLGDINIRYSQNFDKHAIYGVAGFNISESTYETKDIHAEGFPNEKMNDISFAKQYYKDSRPSSSYNINRLAGFLATINYSYDNKYLFDASFKYDGSSQFGSNKRFAPIWSVGAGWNIHKEDFLQDTQVTQLKIRSSYGVTASQNFSPYQAIRKYSYDISRQYAGIIGATMIGLGNNDLKWQQTKKSNIGIDLGFFNDRILFTFDYYRQQTTNLLADVTIAPSLGFLSFTDNIGETENNGYEFSLRYMFLRDNTQGLYWSVNFSGAHNSNKITKISDAMKKRNEDVIQKAYEEGNTAPLILYQEGNSMTSIYAVRSLGIDPSNGKEMFLTKEGIKTYTWNSADQVKVGDTRPDLEGIFGTSLNWKDFSFSVNFRYSFGGELYNNTLVSRVENADLYQNVDKRVYEQRWREPGDIAFFKDIKDKSYTRPSSRFVQDNNYLSCESVSIGYDIKSPKILHFIRAERLKLTAYLNDIYRWSSIDIERGLDYPFARRLAFSLNVSF